jgi:hypothetical protein
MSAKAAVLKRPHISKKEEEEKTERKRRRPIGVATGALLIERTEAAKVLGNCSISTLIRLETAGKLTPHKLAGSPLGKTFYEHTEVVALSKGAMMRADRNRDKSDREYLDRLVRTKIFRRSELRIRLDVPLSEQLNPKELQALRKALARSRWFNKAQLKVERDKDMKQWLATLLFGNKGGDHV